jgi:hypothetical protein
LTVIFLSRIKALPGRKPRRAVFFVCVRHFHLIILYNPFQFFWKFVLFNQKGLGNGCGSCVGKRI